MNSGSTHLDEVQESNEHRKRTVSSIPGVPTACPWGGLERRSGVSDAEIRRVRRNLKIITIPNPSLREQSKKVTDCGEKTQEIISDMIKLSLDWEKSHEFELSAAMAAPQMGINKRIIIVRDDMENKDNASFTALINPQVIKTEGKELTDYEGCLSVPNIYGKVPRPEKARIKARLADGSEVRIKAEADLVRILLHEIDHLNGILFIDHIKDEKDAFYELDKKGDLIPLDYDEHIKNNKTLFPDE